jgi:Ni,Fe-hydrogenase III large subunit
MLRERLMRECDAISGSRFLKGIISIGGITREIDDAILVHLKKTVEEVGTELPGLFRWLYTVPSIHDRFATTGIIRPDLIRPLALSGPVARASGSYTDTRTDHPYGVYLFRQPDGIRETKGDVLARFLVKSEEVAASLRFISDLISEIPDGPVSTDVTIPDGYALSLIESPRGMNIHWLLISNGRISRYKVRTASFCNWQAIEHAVMGNIVPDFPVINKSMNLSYTGRDL